MTWGDTNEIYDSYLCCQLRGHMSTLIFCSFSSSPSLLHQFLSPLGFGVPPGLTCLWSLIPCLVFPRPQLSGDASKDLVRGPLFFFFFFLSPLQFKTPLCWWLLNAYLLHSYLWISSFYPFGCHVQFSNLRQPSRVIPSTPVYPLYVLSHRLFKQTMLALPQSLGEVVSA